MTRSRSSSSDCISCKKARKHSHRRSVEQKLDSLTDALTAVQNTLAQQAILQARTPGKSPSKLIPQHVGALQVGKGEVVIAGESKTTIYKNAVEQCDPRVSEELDKMRQELANVNIEKQASTSSDEAIDTSDELMEVDNSLTGNQVVDDHGRDQPAGGTVRSAQLALEANDGMTVAQKMIKEAELTRSRMVAAKGEESNFHNFLWSAYVDEEYMVIGSHVEEGLCKRIVNHEYVDFAKLLPWDRVGMEED